MKKICLTVMTLMAAMMSFVAQADEHRIDKSQLPKDAQTFIAKHFAGDDVLYVECDKGVFTTDYEVVLKSGVRIEFDSDGDWEEVSNRKVAVPASIIPANIAKYVESNFPGEYIRDISRDRRGYDVELSNGLDLDFSTSGVFERIDD